MTKVKMTKRLLALLLVLTILFGFIPVAPKAYATDGTDAISLAI